MRKESTWKRICLQYRRHRRCRFHPWAREDPLEEAMATHSNILTWKNPKDRGAWQATCSPQGHKKSEMTERLSTFLKNMYLFPWLLCVSVMALGTLSWGVWGPAPQPGMEPRSPRWKRGLTASWPPGKSLHSYFDVFEVSRKKNLKAGKCIHTIYTHNGNRSVN